MSATAADFLHLFHHGLPALARWGSGSDLDLPGAGHLRGSGLSDLRAHLLGLGPEEGACLAALSNGSLEELRI